MTLQSDEKQATIVSKEMGLTHKEFYDKLPALLDGIPYDQGRDTITFRLDGRAIEITLGPQGTRQLGRSIHLPVTPVTMRFFDCSAEEIGRFIRHFNRRYMKGGG